MGLGHEVLSYLFISTLEFYKVEPTLRTFWNLKKNIKHTKLRELEKSSKFQYKSLEKAGFDFTLKVFFFFLIIKIVFESAYYLFSSILQHQMTERI